MKDYKLIADKLFPKCKMTIEELEDKYPARNLPLGAKATRVAPSPTGYMHIGHLLVALIAKRLASQSGGLFFLRIEDTDKNREMEGAIKIIIDSLNYFGILPDEGEVEHGKEIGNYGPYMQSDRLVFYEVCAKWLVESNLAYPCFATTEELEKITAEQEEQKLRPGIRGKWAIWRDKSDEEILAALAEGKHFVIRLRSNGDFENKIKINDQVRGEREMSENDLDAVLLKSDGYPVYHFAHVVDDHLMKTTDVVRGDEWLPSLPLHLQLWKTFGWTPTRYCHISPIQKIDNGNRRKLSKRKDPEANVQFFVDVGYPAQALVEYLLNLLNSSFEDWRKANLALPNTDFKIDVSKFPISGALFDQNKMDDISKNIIASFTAEQVYDMTLAWMNKFDPEFAKTFSADPNYAKAILSIERGVPNGRKDIAKWSDVKTEFSYFFEPFTLGIDEVKNLLIGIDWNDIVTACTKMSEQYDINDDKDTWFGKVKNIATELGYSTNGKEYKADPSKFKGQVGDIAKGLRVFMTGRTISPDLHQIMKVLGKEKTVARLNAIK
jgi:glutamyl-tRNA synthetase